MTASARTFRSCMRGGACAIVHSDSEVGIQRLNQEAAKALADGRRAGLTIITRRGLDLALAQSRARARHRGRDRHAASAGRRADVVVWSGDPFSSYALAERVYMDGALVYQRGEAAGAIAPISNLAKPIGSARNESSATLCSRPWRWQRQPPLRPC